MPYSTDQLKSFFSSPCGLGKKRKEVIHRQIPLAIPCYDLPPIIEFTLIRLTADFGYPRLS